MWGWRGITACVMVTTMRQSRLIASRTLTKASAAALSRIYSIHPSRWLSCISSIGLARHFLTSRDFGKKRAGVARSHSIIGYIMVTIIATWPSMKLKIPSKTPFHSIGTEALPSPATPGTVSNSVYPVGSTFTV